MRQQKLALLSARVGKDQFSTWGMTGILLYHYIITIQSYININLSIINIGPLTTVQHNHDNRTIVGGNQFNVTSSGSGNVSVGNVTNIQEPASGRSGKRFFSTKYGSPSDKRHKHADNTNYSSHFSNKTKRPAELIDAEEKLAAARNKLDSLNALYSSDSESEYQTDYVIIDDEEKDKAELEVLQAEINLRAHCGHHKQLRNQYTAEEKVDMIKLFDLYSKSGAISKEDAFEKVKDNNRAKYGHLNYQDTIPRWKNNQQNGIPLENKRGHKVDQEFRDLVETKLRLKVYTDMHNKILKGDVTNDNFYEQIVSCCYSYEVVRYAAIKAKIAYKDLKGENSAVYKSVQKLEFSNNWIHAFLNEKSLHKRLITTTRKAAKCQDEVEINKILDAISAKIKEGKYCLQCIISADETGINWDAALLHQYVSKGEVPLDSGDDKKRFTAMIWVRADGKTGPPFIILKCSSKDKYNYKNVKVIDSLFEKLDKDHPYRYKLKWWSKNLKLKTGKNTEEIKHCYRPFIEDLNTGTIITCNNKAWMDTVTLIMWGEVQIGPYAEAQLKAGNGRTIIVWDNCGPHTREYVKKLFEEMGIDVICLPKNMTWLLQVVDVIINGPLKAYDRKLRAKLRCDYFTDYSEEISRLKEGDDVPLWNPGSVSILEGVENLVQTIEEKFNTSEEFQESVRNCFIKVGILPSQTETVNGVKEIYRRFNKALMKTVEQHDGIKQDEDHLLDKDADSSTATFHNNEVMELVQFIDLDNEDADIDDGDVIFDDADGVAPTEEVDADIRAPKDPIVAPKAPEPVPIVFISAESVKHFKQKKAIMPYMTQRGFQITNDEPLKRLKELLVEFDKKRHDDASIAPVVDPAAVVPAAVVPAAVVPAAVVPAAVVPPINASCWCKKPDNNEMIFCSFENCPHGWFHFKCIGLTRASAKGLPNDWMCHLCK